MAQEIWRLSSFWIWIESTPWTEWTLDCYIPLEKWSLTPKVEKKRISSGYWVIDANSQNIIVKQMWEFDFEGILRSKTIWWLLLLALWTSSSPTLQETWVYKHSFTRKNDNAHPSCTVFNHNTVQQEKMLYSMIQNLNFEFKVWEVARFTWKMIWQLPVAKTGLTPSWLSWDEEFVVSQMSVKYATDISWLAAASRIWVESIWFWIEKNLKQVFESKLSTTEALDFSFQWNQQFIVTWDWELRRASETYKNMVKWNTNYAFEIEITWRTLIWATKYNTITIQFASVSLEDWKASDNLDELTNEQFWFVWLYKLSETKTMTIDLINTLSSQYA